MRRYLFCCMTVLLSLVFSAPSFAQLIPCVDTSAVIIGHDSASILLGGGLRESALRGGASRSSGTGQIIWEFITMAHGGSQITHVIDLQSIHVEGDGSQLDGMTTPEIFTAIAIETIKDDIAANGGCVDTCMTRQVRQSACVQRIGSGSSTTFNACPGSQCCTRIFQVCCDGNGTPTITLIGIAGDSCPAGAPEGCQSSCSESGNSLSDDLHDSNPAHGQYGRE